MAKVDLRTYLLLERAFVRRLQRSWRQQSAPLYQKITQACLDHKWDEARRLVPDLDMAEVGTENREWITYMLLSCAVFGAGTVAKKKPSFVSAGTFDTLLKQVTSNLLQYLEYNATAQVQAEAMQSIAEDEAKTKAAQLKVAFDPSQPRDDHGRWVDTEGITHVGEFVELYHGTSRLRANKILKEGFKIRAVAKPTMGGDPESSRNYIWLAKRMASAQSYSEMHRHPVVVTVRLPHLLYKKLHPYGRNTGPDSVWSPEPISAKYVHVGTQKWDADLHPRDTDGKFTDAGRMETPEELAQQLDRAIRQGLYAAVPPIPEVDLGIGPVPQRAGGFDPTKKETWYKISDGWNRSPEGDKPYGWIVDTKGYEPPLVTHTSIRGSNVGLWGGSHYGSRVITGESAQQMGIEGWKNYAASKESIDVATRMLQAIANDTTGSEEPLYHSFENVRKTVFTVGDTMRLPLTATAGSPSSYGVRLEHEDLEGAPTYFKFATGTPMVGYSKPEKRALEDLDASTVEDAYKNAGFIWDEAIVAGKYRVTKVESGIYMGSQHSMHPTPMALTHQLYGQVVHLEPLEVFDPTTKSWRPRG